MMANNETGLFPIEEGRRIVKEKSTRFFTLTSSGGRKVNRLKEIGG